MLGGASQDSKYPGVMIPKAPRASCVAAGMGCVIRQAFVKVLSDQFAGRDQKLQAIKQSSIASETLGEQDPYRAYFKNPKTCGGSCSSKHQGAWRMAWPFHASLVSGLGIPWHPAL